MRRKNYHGQTQSMIMHIKIFRKLFNQRWKNDEGERIVFTRSGAGGYSTKGVKGYMPTDYIWQNFNNNTEFIGESEKYFNRIHTFEVRRSAVTFGVTVEWEIEKCHRHSNVWVPLSAAKEMPAHLI